MERSFPKKAGSYRQHFNDEVLLIFEVGAIASLNQFIAKAFPSFTHCPQYFSQQQKLLRQIFRVYAGLFNTLNTYSSLVPTASPNPCYEKAAACQAPEIYQLIHLGNHHGC